MELEKMSITAFADPLFKEEISGLNLKVNINPESYTLKSQFIGNDVEIAGGGNVPKKNIEPKPGEISLDFWFDGTGAIAGSEDVVEDIKKFKNIALKYNNEIHSTNYVLLEWGDLNFKGQLKSLSVNYQLFRPDGSPVRAKATAIFQELIDSDTKIKSKNNKSPDLTRVKTVRDGDTLPLMCYQAYKDSSYYLEVAFANGLENFTKLRPGQQIVFPPLEK